ncbi:hypothetical protein CHS0354_000416 [Potamilus streckersoni]|uniref:HD-GYP domain-containing protein n=1 Tax=Potamilus streckersoni TaxID=2493646 RepID=A0AAE0T796_9BIVA|nr:hypothetical protein CHS0354_000416 [Potamilus streckersoni]
MLLSNTTTFFKIKQLKQNPTANDFPAFLGNSENKLGAVLILRIDRIKPFYKKYDLFSTCAIPVIAIIPQKRTSNNPKLLTTLKNLKKNNLVFFSNPSEIALSSVLQTLYLYFLKNDTQKYALQVEKDNYELLHKIAINLTSERNIQKLLHLILINSIKITHADAGSIYTVSSSNDKILSERHKLENKLLHFKHTYNFSRNFPFKEFTLPLNTNSLVGYACLNQTFINIPDAYALPKSSPYTFNSSFDHQINYKTKSILTVPMLNRRGEPIGAVQLINKKKQPDAILNSESDFLNFVISFSNQDEQLMLSLASLAAIAYENQIFFEDQSNLLDSLAEVLAHAIDMKSPYTGKHCARVPIITKMIAEAACNSNEPPFKNFSLNDEQWRELHLAAWLHDAGKIVTPVHIMDKPTKLHKLFDVIDHIKLRIEILKRDILDSHKPTLSEDEKKLKLNQTQDDLEFLQKVNLGSETLSNAAIQRVQSIAQKTYLVNQQPLPLLSNDEVMNLSIQKGTLNETERQIINNHISVTIQMLDRLPFPSNLARVPEFAGAHHEKMDGTGYPNNLTHNQLSIPAKIMIIADIFEALSSADRPYKQPHSLSKIMSIMGKMKRNNHFDPDLFNLFIKEKIYLKYATLYLQPNLIDSVDEQALIDIVPKYIEQQN